MATYIGIDIGKKNLQIYCPVKNRSFAVFNNNKEWLKLYDYLKITYGDLSNLIVAFEPTGGYERGLKNFLYDNIIAFTLVHPTKVRRYAQAKGLMAKTDKLDSKLIHDYAQAFNLLPVNSKIDPNHSLLQDLLQRRQQLMALKNQETNRLEHTCSQAITNSLNQHVSYLDQELESINQQINDFTTTDSNISHRMKILTSIPGVGITLATTIIAELPELEHTDSRKIISLIGLAPFARDSGGYKGKRSIFAGRSMIRKVLYMAAVASLRVNKPLQLFYRRLIANHKPPEVALVAIMRKLVLFMQALIKKNSLWNHNYVLS